MRAGRISLSSSDATSGAPCSVSMVSRIASSPRRCRVTPCQAVIRRPSVAGSTGSTWCRTLASDRRRIWPSTPGSHHSRCVPPGRKSPSCSRPAPTARRKRLLDHGLAQGEVPRHVAGGERAVRARIAHHQVEQRIADRLEERRRQPGRQRRAERVAVAAGVLDGDEPRLAADRQAQHPAGADQRLDRVGGAAGDRAAHLDAGGGQVADAQQQIVDAVDGAHVPLGGEVLQLVLDARRWRRGRARRAARRRRAAP